MVHLFSTRTRAALIVVVGIALCVACERAGDSAGSIDWGHFRLGQRSDPDFLARNHMTVTFGSGAPNFERVTRAEFDQRMAEAKDFNRSYHDQDYVVLRYLSTALNGASLSNRDDPRKDQINLLKFYRERWEDFADYIGPKPAEDPTSWIMIHSDGSFPHYRYAPYGRETGKGFETWGCPHNPYYVRMMEGRVRAQAETGIDGSYVDWTHIAGGTCYCDYSRQAFAAYLDAHLPDSVAQAKYGMSDYDNITLPNQRGDAFWMEWITFRGYSVAEFHRRLRTAARKHNPDFMISGNVFGGFGYGPIAYDAAGNMEMLGKVDDFIYSEIQEFLDSAPRKDRDGTKITNSPALKFLAAASHNKPVIVYATEITPPIFPDPSEKALSAMAQINIAEAVANHAIFREKRQTPPGATEMYAFLAANESYLLEMKLASNIAILASLNQYLADEQSYAFSLSRVFADHGVGHVMIVEDDLMDDGLVEYDIVILPNIPLLSKAKQLALVDYVRGGGQLLILGKSGIKDEYNMAVKEPPLAKMLNGSTFPPQSTVMSFGEGRVGYLLVEAPEGGFLIPAREKGDVTTFGPAMMDVFADIPEGYTRNRMDPQLRRILEECVRHIMEALSDQISRVLRAPKYVELTTMLADDQDRLLVHLVNYDVTVDGTVTPATDLSVQILLPEGRRIESVVYSGTLGEMKPLTFRTQQANAGQMVLIAPDTLETYGLAVIELAKN